MNQTQIMQENAANAPEGLRVFAYVKEPNTRFQIKEGSAELNQPIITLGDGPIYPPYRTGDKFIEFSEGLCATSDPEVITWCEARYPDVVDIQNDPTAESLIAVARMQQVRAEYEPNLSAESVDLTRIIRDSANAAVKRAVENERIRLGLDPETGQLPVTEQKVGD